MPHAGLGSSFACLLSLCGSDTITSHSRLNHWLPRRLEEEAVTGKEELAPASYRTRDHKRLCGKDLLAKQHRPGVSKLQDCHKSQDLRVGASPGKTWDPADSALLHRMH